MHSVEREDGTSRGLENLPRALFLDLAAVLLPTTGSLGHNATCGAKVSAKRCLNAHRASIKRAAVVFKRAVGEKRRG